MADIRLRKQWDDIGQGHVFNFWESLSADERQVLLQDLRDVGDPKQLQRALEEVLGSAEDEQGDCPEAKVPEPLITAFDRVVDRAELSQQTRYMRLASGLAAIAAGEVAVVTLAGGQGTRLGSKSPKGCYDVGLPSGKSLYQLQAEKIAALFEVACKACGVEQPPLPGIPWLVMTSPSTDAETKQHFEENNWFGLEAGILRVFTQSQCPAVDRRGKVLLAARNRLALSPNGNGGVFEALQRSGALQFLRRETPVRWIHVIGIDNLLVKPADPEFLGLALDLPETHVLNKVVLKTDPEEKVGVMCFKDGVPSVVEYSEITQEMSRRTLDNGNLMFGAANIADHLFRLDFLEKTEGQMPWHRADKVVPYLDRESGECIVPQNPNAVKLEKFVFDIFGLDPKLTAFVVDRAEEFAPIKNKEGEASPEHARNILSTLHKRYAGELSDKPVTWEGEGLFELSSRLSVVLDHEDQKQRFRRTLSKFDQQGKLVIQLPLFLE